MSALPDSSPAAFARRYNRIMRLTFLVVALIAGLLFALQFQARLDAKLEDARRDMVLRAQGLDHALKTSSDHVEGMQLVAQRALREMVAPPPASPLYQALTVREDKGFWTLDAPPERFPKSTIGNLTAVPTEQDGDYRREVEMALALNPLFEAAQASLPNLGWAYYTSERKFINIFPWVAAKDFAWTPELYTHSWWKDAVPGKAASRNRFWTEAYIDSAGKGLMVTCSAPVHDPARGDLFRGTVAVDLTLDVLNEFVRLPEGSAARAFVANNFDQLLAHPGVVSSSATAVRAPAESLPPELAALGPALYQDSLGGIVQRQGYFVLTLELTEAPWRMVWFMPRSALIQELLGGSIWEVAGLLLGLGLMLVMAGRSTKREFVVPAIGLVRHIEAESRAEAVGIPKDLPGAWQPWFEAISRVFNEHGQLVSIRQELDVARRMQQSILPTRFPQRRDVQIWARMLAAKEVGGDFYDFFWLDEHRLGLVIADVSGKGVPAALFMAVARTLLRATAPVAGGPAEALSTTNDLIAADNDASMFVTVFYGVLDVRDGSLTYASGGHNPACLMLPDGSVRVLQNPEGVALGAMEGMDYTETTVTVPPGAALVLYTDGVTEAFDVDGNPFGDPRLVRALEGAAGKSSEAVVAHLFADVEAFAIGAPQADDITCLVVRRGEDGHG